MYSDFTLLDLKVKFKIKNKRKKLFTGIENLTASSSLKESLEIARHLSVKSEKAKSELILMPILIDLMKRNENFFTIYSGDTLVADKATGLTGECDFILAKETGSFDINTPIISIVEAKKSDLEIGIPQCAAQMLGARIYNEKMGNPIEDIYGCVTTAHDWVFMKLEGSTLFIDIDKYYLNEIEHLLGIFQSIIDYYKGKLDDSKP